MQICSRYYTYDFLQKRIRQQDLSRKEGESKDFQWVINYSNLNLLPPFGKMCLLNLHQFDFFTGGIKVIDRNICYEYAVIVECNFTNVYSYMFKTNDWSNEILKQS